MYWQITLMFFFLNKKTTYNNKPDTFNLLLQRFLRLQPSLSDKIKTKINLLEWETRPKRENLNKCPPVVVCVSTAVTKVDMWKCEMWSRWTVSSRESAYWLWWRRWLCWTLWSAGWRAASPAGPGGCILDPTEPRLHPVSERWKQQQTV